MTGPAYNTDIGNPGVNAHTGGEAVSPVEGGGHIAPYLEAAPSALLFEELRSNKPVLGSGTVSAGVNFRRVSNTNR